MQLFSCTVALLLSFAASSLTNAFALRPQPAKRMVCNTDNVLRALQRSRVAASTFCSSLIPLTTTTSYLRPTPTITPTYLTTTATSFYTIYPNGKHLESVGLPKWLPVYPLSRYSSGCSCLPLAEPTATVTISQRTQTLTKTVTYTNTLAGPCATQTPYPYAVNYTIPYGGNTANGTALFSISDSYACCTECQPNMYFPACIAWLGGPGYCEILYTPPSPTSAACGDGDTTVFEDQVIAPDNLGGPGHCAGTIAVKTGS